MTQSREVTAIVEYLKQEIGKHLAPFRANPSNEEFRQEAEKVFAKHMRELFPPRNIEYDAYVVDEYAISFNSRGAVVHTLSEGTERRQIQCRSARHAKRIALLHMHTVVVNYKSPVYIPARSIHLQETPECLTQSDNA